MPRVTILHFAVLREKRGHNREEIEVPEGSTLVDVFRMLFSEADHDLPLAFARNRNYAFPDEVVEEGDEISFVPPLGGG